MLTYDSTEILRLRYEDKSPNSSRSSNSFNDNIHNIIPKRITDITKMLHVCACVRVCVCVCVCVCGCV